MSGKIVNPCQYCYSSCIKCGKHSNGSQKLQCKSCKKYQLLTYSNKACIKKVKDNITKIYLKNVGIRDVASLLNISVNTVIKEIKKYKDFRPNIFFSPNQEYEIDEMRTYVKNKKRRRWIAYAIEKTTRAVISIAVGKRNNTTLKKVVDSVLSLSPKKVYTDGLKNYKSLIPLRLHKIQKTKMQRIERKNLTCRGKLRRLNRKTIAFSKSEIMLQASAKLFFWNTEISALSL